MSSPLLQLGLWSFLPSTLTQVLLNTLAKSSLYTPPPPNTPAQAKHHRIAFTFVIGLYLAYTLHGAIRGDGGIQGMNWYELLGVKGDASEDELKKGYRTFARLYHPDRAGADGEAIFIIVRNAFEALSDPVKRFAYDRFGPDVTTWKNCATQKEFMMRGLSQAVGFYVVSGGIMVLIAFFGKARAGAYWRTVLFLALLSSELSIILTPNSSPALRILSTVMPRKRQYEHVQLLHSLWTATSLAISQLAGLWTPPTNDGSRDAELLNRVAILVKANEIEAIRLFHAQTSALPRNVAPQFKAEMEQVLVDAAVRTHPAIKASWDQALLRPRESRHKFSHLPTPSPEPDVTLGHAMRIPLPPSPPPSPARRLMEL